MIISRHYDYYAYNSSESMLIIALKEGNIEDDGRIEKQLAFWRTRSGSEVDFIVGSEAAIEVKAAERITDRHMKGLRAIAEERMIHSFMVVSFDELDRRTEDGVRLLHWETFLKELWTDAFGW